ncbi:peptidase [Bacillus sp. F19]|nr:peptidase [Bacillus sp. F19]
MDVISLDNIIVENNRVDFHFNVTGKLKKYFKSNHLFFEYNYDLSDVPFSILTITFVANVMPLVWITDTTLEINELDKNFKESINNIRNAYQEMFPRVIFKGEIKINNIIENSYQPVHEVACLFSGGLDALTTFIRKKAKKPLLITEYGWHEKTIKNSDVWNADKINAINFAKGYGLNNILIQSNYGTILNAQEIDYDFQKRLGDSWWHGLHHGLAIITAAIPIAHKLKIKCINIASSNSPIYKVPCASDPTVDNLIKYSSGEVFHDAYELNRQEKVKVVVDYYSKTNAPVNIRVCFKREENCCKCEKCLRTMLGIVAEGEDPNNFGFYFDGTLSDHVKHHLNNEVKFFTDIFIYIYWTIIQQRMKENEKNIVYKDLLDWFLDYNFNSQRKKELLKYRIINFFPIIIRKITYKFDRLIIQKS